jgi:hypothetical protein
VGRSRRDRTTDEKIVKIVAKKSFFYVMSEVQKDLQDVSAGIGQFKKNPTYKNFV